MTIREYLIGRKRLYSRFYVLSLIIMVGSLAMASVFDKSWVSWVFAAACLAYIGALQVYKFGVRCPNCRGNVGWSSNYFGGKGFLFLRPIVYCQFCGVFLDSDMPSRVSG